MIAINALSNYLIIGNSIILLFSMLVLAFISQDLEVNV